MPQWFSPSPTQSRSGTAGLHSSTAFHCVSVCQRSDICSPLTFSVPYATVGNGTHVHSINSTALCQCVPATVSTCICSWVFQERERRSNFTNEHFRRDSTTSLCEREGVWRVRSNADPNTLDFIFWQESQKNTNFCLLKEMVHPILIFFLFFFLFWHTTLHCASGGHSFQHM